MMKWQVYEIHGLVHHWGLETFYDKFPYAEIKQIVNPIDRDHYYSYIYFVDMSKP